MEDERLADLLEELPEDEQIRIIEGLDLERAADVLEAMDPDDAADLLGELPADERARLLEAMEPDEATPVRRLLTYESATAGGLMTPEPVIMPPGATVAEALALLRVKDAARSRWPPRSSWSTRPLSMPTGRFLGARRLPAAAPRAAVEPARATASPSGPSTSRPTSRRSTSPAASRPTTWCRSRCATAPAGWSARSPSTT